MNGEPNQITVSSQDASASFSLHEDFEFFTIQTGIFAMNIAMLWELVLLATAISGAGSIRIDRGEPLDENHPWVWDSLNEHEQQALLVAVAADAGGESLINHVGRVDNRELSAEEIERAETYCILQLAELMEAMTGQKTDWPLQVLLA